MTADKGQGGGSVHGARRTVIGGSPEQEHVSDVRVASWSVLDIFVVPTQCGAAVEGEVSLNFVGVHGDAVPLSFRWEGSISCCSIAVEMFVWRCCGL
jgi:hypothetical protein